MATMITVGLAQKHIGGHALDLLFTAEQGNGDLDVEEIKINSMKLRDHFLVRFRLVATHSQRQGTKLYGLSQRQMDPEGLSRALRDFPGAKTGASSELLIDV